MMACRRHSIGRASGLTASIVAVAAMAWSGCNVAACGGKKSGQSEPAAQRAETADKANQYGLTPEQAKQVLVKVGDTVITLGDFAERLGSQSPYLRARYHSPERRREFLENMVRFELLANEAKKRGLDKTDDVERVRKQVMVQQMMQDMFDKGGVKLSDITDAEIKAYYDAHLSEFDRPAQVRASHILFKDRAAAEKALKTLKQAPQAPTDMELFRKLAQEHNLDPATKDSFGDLRFFSATKDPSGETDEPERPDAVRKAAFSLANVGDVYPEVVQSERGFHIVKLTAKREAMKRSLEDARRMIQNKLWREKREQAIEKFVAELRKKANVQENEEALAKVQVRDAVGHTKKVSDDAPEHSDATVGSKGQSPPAPAKPVKK